MSAIYFHPRSASLCCPADHPLRQHRLSIPLRWNGWLSHLFQLNLLLLLSFFIVIPAHPLPLEYTHYIILQILCQFSKTLYSSYDSFAYTATDGKKYNVDYYNLDVIISVGYRVKSHRGTQFRIWAMGILKEYMKKGFALDDDRLKRLGGGNYFDELLARIRDIRSSEKVFWRKVLEIYATSIDYDPHAESSVLFFKQVQNKMHWAAHKHTAAEVIYERADAEKENFFPYLRKLL